MVEGGGAEILFCQRKMINKFRVLSSLIYHYRAQMLMKGRLAGAQKGHGLLKKKADALQMRFRQILSKIIEVSVPIDFYLIPFYKNATVHYRTLFFFVLSIRQKL